MSSARAFCLAAFAALFSGCSPFASSGQSMLTPAARSTEQAQRVSAASISPGAYIKHVIVIVQENRSFENLFAGFPGANAPSYGFGHAGNVVPLRQVPLKSSTDIAHYFLMATKEWDQGKMDAFDEDNFAGGGAAGTYPYAYVARSDIQPYWDMARQYVLADHMFPTIFGPSFTAHLDLIAGTAALSSTLTEVDTPNQTPWTCDAPGGTTTDTWSTAGVWKTNGPPPCFTQFKTIADLLDASKVSWKYYAPVVGAGGELWSAFGAISNVRYGSDWAKNVVTPETTVFTDISSGELPAVSWVIPSEPNSDHTGNNSDTGPSWVASIVNAVGTSQYWKSSAVVILWDDWGGWYDNVPPPQLDYAGLGIRVPCIIVSPYARTHYVSHTQYEFGSTLAFIEQVFGLPSLGYTDARANSLTDAFNLSSPPRSFQVIKSKYTMPYFRHQRRSRKAPDDD